MARHWLQELGFHVDHAPGISRAWRDDFPDGSCLLITDLGGFDLPERGGPYSAMCLSQQDELVEFEPLLPQAKDLYQFIDHQRRLSQRRHNRSDQT